MYTKLNNISTYQSVAKDAGGSAAGTVILRVVYRAEI